MNGIGAKQLAEKVLFVLAMDLAGAKARLILNTFGTTKVPSARKLTSRTGRALTQTKFEMLIFPQAV